MTTATDKIQEMLRLANEGENPNAQPAIILNHNIDPTKITECTVCHVNDSWAEQMKKLLDTGWIMFRMQTEFGINGHHTMAYFAKLRPEQPS